MDGALAQECIDVGGCYETCGSGCGLTKPTIDFFEMFDFYFDDYICSDVCSAGCLYPIN